MAPGEIENIGFVFFLIIVENAYAILYIICQANLCSN